MIKTKVKIGGITYIVCFEVGEEYEENNLITKSIFIYVYIGEKIVRKLTEEYQDYIPPSTYRFNIEFLARSYDLTSNEGDILRPAKQYFTANLHDYTSLDGVIVLAEIIKRLDRVTVDTTNDELEAFVHKLRVKNAYEIVHSPRGYRIKFKGFKKC